jgi:hypothetical protein
VACRGDCQAIVSGAAAAVIGLAASAATAPTEPGTAPFDQATVVAVRPGRTYARTDTGVSGVGKVIHATVTDTTVW